MKKNISINISGIIFHIEEDGYDKLKEYLNNIAQYFSSFEDSKEITSDIESRIAEIFLSKLKDDKQIITKEDVEELIATMGSVEDFEAAEKVYTEEEPSESHSRKDEETYSGQTYGTRKLERDESRKIIGGVCSGIAAYFKVDPLWIRLLTIILFLISYGTLIVVYLVLWAVLPASKETPDDRKIKKMFRNPDDKVIGGVASGVAMYFGVDSLATRLIFVALILAGGTGILAYLILWLILPEAKSITEKVQMQGEPVTLSNIEHNVKKSLNVKEGEEENIFVKILLFPFRLLATIFTGLGKALGPLLLVLVDFIRVITGLALSFTGIIGIFSAVAAGGIIYGIFNESWHLMDLQLGHPVGLFIDSIPPVTQLAAILMVILPFILLILLGISIIARRLIFSSTVGWSLFGVFIICTIILSINVPAIVYGFHETSTYEDTRTYSVDDKTTVIKVNNAKGITDYDEVDFEIKGHEKSTITLNLEYYSQGSSPSDALENAKSVKYYTSLEDSILWLGASLDFPKEAKFRFQELEGTIYMPYDHKFILDESMSKLVRYYSINQYGYSMRDINGDNIWVFNEYGLECITCDRKKDGWGTPSSDKKLSRLFDFENFSSVTVNSPITVRLSTANEFRVEAIAEERFLSDLDLSQNDDELTLDILENKRRVIRSRDAIVIKISAPSLNSIRLSQASKAYIDEIEADVFRIDMNGASSAKIKADAKLLDIELNGNSKLELIGTGESMKVESNGLSTLEGYRFRVKNAEVDANGASSLQLNVTEQIKVSRDAVSSVKFRGGAEEIE